MFAFANSCHSNLTSCVLTRWGLTVSNHTIIVLWRSSGGCCASAYPYTAPPPTIDNTSKACALALMQREAHQRLEMSPPLRMEPAVKH